MRCLHCFVSRAAIPLWFSGLQRKALELNAIVLTFISAFWFCVIYFPSKKKKKSILSYNPNNPSVFICEITSYISSSKNGITTSLRGTQQNYSSLLFTRACVKFWASLLYFIALHFKSSLQSMTPRRSEGMHLRITACFFSSGWENGCYEFLSFAIRLNMTFRRNHTSFRSCMILSGQCGCSSGQSWICRQWMSQCGWLILKENLPLQFIR